MILIPNDVIRLASLTASSTAAGHHVNNLAADTKSNSWRSTAVTSQTITATWSAPQTINAVGIAFANFLVGSTVRARLFTNTGDGSPVVDSGVQTINFVYPPPAGFAANNLSSFAYGGGNYFFLPVTQASVRKLEVIVTNPAGVDTFIEMARLVAGQASQINSGMSFGSEVGFKDQSRVDRTDGGDAVIDRRPVSKTISLDLSLLTSAERAIVQAIARRNSVHTPVFISAYEKTTDLPTKMDYQIYGYLTGQRGISLESAVYSALKLSVEEI